MSFIRLSEELGLWLSDHNHIFQKRRDICHDKLMLLLDFIGFVDLLEFTV